MISLVDHTYTQQLAERVLLIIMDQVKGSMKTADLREQYENTYGEDLKVEEIASHLREYVQVKML